MIFLIPMFTAGSILVSPLVVRTGTAQTLPLHSVPRFIVLCDCATPLKRAKVQRSIRNAGGKTVLTYESLGGFAVEPSNVRYVPRLEYKLRGIKGVTSVEADGVAGINSPS